MRPNLNPRLEKHNPKYLASNAKQFGMLEGVKQGRLHCQKLQLLLAIALTASLFFLGSVSTVFAAPESVDPTTPAHPIKDDQVTEPAAEAGPPLPTDLEIAPAPMVAVEAAERPVPFIYNYTSSISPRLGFYRGSRNAEVTYGVVGIAWMLKNTEVRHTELGLDATSNSQAILHWSQRWMFSQNEKFRPTASLGISLKSEPTDGIAAPITLVDYRLRATGGFEYSIHKSLSLRLDLELSQSTEETTYLASLGYSFGI